MGVLRLLLGTLMLRPYVFVFLAVYLCAAVTRMGWAKTAVVVFNLVITLWIGEPLLALVGCLLYLPVVVLFVSHPLNPMRRAGSAELARHREDFPASPIVLSPRVQWRPS